MGAGAHPARRPTNGNPLRTTLLTLPLAAAIALAGCGASGPSKAEYIKQADAVCTAAGKKLQTAQTEAAQKLAKNPDPKALEGLVTDVLVPNAEEQLLKLRALEKPEKEASTINAIYDDLETGLQKTKADPSTITDDPAGELASANKKARAFGMKVCGGQS